MPPPDAREPTGPPLDLGDALARARAALPDSDASLIEQVVDDLTAVGWAEDEITAAGARHPHHRDLLWHSLSLLHRTHSRMSTEFIHRSHCRELLDRVAAGRDTEPATAAEAACALLDAALQVPLRPAAFGLFTRMWQVAGFSSFPEIADTSIHHEALQSARIDDHERWLRAELAVPGRRLREIRCGGLHHAEPVRCRFARPPTPG